MSFKVDKKGRFNGKSMKHWERMAHELVVEELLRAALRHDANPAMSIVGYMASNKLMIMARNLDDELVGKLIDERNNWRIGALAALQALTSPEEDERVAESAPEHPRGVRSSSARFKRGGSRMGGKATRKK